MSGTSEYAEACWWADGVAETAAADDRLGRLARMARRIRFVPSKDARGPDEGTWVVSLRDGAIDASGRGEADLILPDVYHGPCFVAVRRDVADEDAEEADLRLAAVARVDMDGHDALRLRFSCHSLSALIDGDWGFRDELERCLRDGDITDACAEMWGEALREAWLTAVRDWRRGGEPHGRMALTVETAAADLLAETINRGTPLGAWLHERVTRRLDDELMGPAEVLSGRLDAMLEELTPRDDEWSESEEEEEEEDEEEEEEEEE